MIKIPMTFFWKSFSPFSQWYMVDFIEDDIKFCCTEQYMMYHKALLFNDTNNANKILKTSSPKRHKKIGREVAGFNNRIWNEHKIRIVKQGNYLKFTQNPDLLTKLFNTKGKLLVEASPYDFVWGIGYESSHPNAKDPSKWKGENLLGYILTELRDELLKDYKNESNS